MSTNGKGDKRRPYDPRKWEAGYQAIDWHREKRSRKPIVYHGRLCTVIIPDPDAKIRVEVV